MYKAVKKEADAAAQLAISLIKKDTAGADGYVEASAICTNAKLKAACEENGVG